MTGANCHVTPTAANVQLLKHFPTFYGTRKFITVFTGPYPEPDASSPYYQILFL
jgi:hypothetical protein